MDDNWIRLLIWVITDGTIVHRSDYNKRIQFKLSKQRKIDSLRLLLDIMKVKYTFREAQKSGINKLQPYYICIYSEDARKICKLLNNSKKFPNWLINIDNILPVLEVLEITDGYRLYKNNFSWISTDYSNVKIIEKLCLNHKIISKYRECDNRSGFPNGKRQYVMNIYLYKDVKK